MSKSILKPPSRRMLSLPSHDNSSSSGLSYTSGSDSDSSSNMMALRVQRPNTITLHHVHFATDTNIYLTHSTTEYDRSPMKVMKNPCAMPARGCPGLTYVSMDDGPGGRQRGVRDMDAVPNEPVYEEDEEVSTEDSCLSEGEECEGLEREREREQERTNRMGENRDRPCQRYALKVSAQKRRRKMNEEGGGVLHLGGFKSLSAFSTLVSHPNDCFGGF